jgi:Flp pilus assembly protein TadB
MTIDRRVERRSAVALKPGSEQPELGAPEDYVAHHPEEHPSQWGWHGEWGRWARISGWVVVIILLVMLTATHYNAAGAIALISSAALLVIALLWDIQRRRTSWRQ